MNSFKLIPIMEKFNNCPKCGNDKIGDGEGKLIAEDDIFIRGCKCGFEVILNEDGKEVQGSHG